MSHSASSMHKYKAVLQGQELKCKNGCGFYGNPEWQGYCSKCHKELNKKIKPLPDAKGSSKKVLRSYSDAHESSLSLGFTKFEEKKKQQSEKRSKTIKSIMKRGHTSKDTMTQSPSREVFPTEEILQLSKELQLKDNASKDILKQMNYQIDVMSKHYDKSIDEQSEVFQDFYNFMTNRFETHQYYQEMSSEQIDQLLDKIEEKLMEHMYTTLFNQISSEYEEKDLFLQNRIRTLNWITAQRLGLDIKEKSPEIRELIDKAITDVIEMNSKIAPQEKIGSIVNCSKSILNIINLSQGVTVSADEFLPAMVYVVLKANPPLLHSNVKYITSYSIPARLRSGEGAYYFTNMCCAVEFIEHLTSESLNLTNEEFERYLAGDGPVDYAEQTITACEGVRLMSQNLATLTELHEKAYKMSSEMELLKEDMTKFQETIKKLKPSSPLQISPTPYKVPANVDMSFIPEIVRSRIIREESDEILVDIDNKIGNGEQTISHNLESGNPNNFQENNVLADIQNLSLDNESQPYAVDPSANHSIIQPLRVALPANNATCNYISSTTIPAPNLPVQNNVSHSVLNIKDLEYPTEIFPDKSEENLLDSVVEERTVNNVIDADEGCLIDTLSSETGLMEEVPPPMLPPPLQPVVLQSAKSENDNQS